MQKALMLVHQQAFSGAEAHLYAWQRKEAFPKAFLRIYGN